MEKFNINKFDKKKGNSNRYDFQIKRLKEEGLYTGSVERAVVGAIENINQKQSRSFVVYGEPQSGKTEMMIALTAKLLDEGNKIIIMLLNDSVQLLGQNLNRFRSAEIDPLPKNFSEVLGKEVKISGAEWIIFAKKNSSDLKKLLDKIDGYDHKVIIDDEADYASPNAKVNKGEQTKINELVEKLIGKNGIYIGVTATPARLDLNNTFENNNERWIDFPPHPQYTGQDVFFPSNPHELSKNLFKLNLLPDQGDNPKYLKECMIRFFVNSAYLNSSSKIDPENYSMLIHTSGKKADHSEDYKIVVSMLTAMKDNEHKKYEKYIKEIWIEAGMVYPGKEDIITQYVVDNVSRSDVVVMNSDKITEDSTRATNPMTPFTFVIGGNIVSRGVTFANLLSMFFTRDVKHKIQQDTYIQRARMFGARNKYLKYFELTIPEHLYLDWHKCFIFHKLSLSSVRNGLGSPIWLEDKRVSSVASASVHKSYVNMDRGEMVFGMFDFTSVMEQILELNLGAVNKLEKINELFGASVLQDYLIDFIKSFSPDGDNSVYIHPVRNVRPDSDYHDTLTRYKGIFGSEASTKIHPGVAHHIMVVVNSYGKARLVYKYMGSIKTLKKSI